MKILPKALPSLVFVASLLAASLPSLHAARTPKPPVVVNVDTGEKYTTMKAALDDASQDEPLTLKFTGTLREKVFIFRPREVTTILGSGARSTLDATGLDDAAITILSEKPVTLRGFTVTGGTGVEALGARRGGGILMRGCERLLLVDMTIRGNSAGIGGGIEVATDQDGGTTVLELAGKTVVRDNQATIAGAGISADAGVTVRLLDRVSVRNNRFAPEAQNGSGGGIGISGSDNAPSKLEMFAKSSVTGNFAPFLGGGIYVSGNVSVTASKGVLISGNTVEGDGGGVAATSGAGLNSPTMSFDCTFLNNLATDIATSRLGRGGAIFCGAGGLDLRPGARVFANNADEGGGICVFGSEIDPEVPVLKITGSVLRGNFGERAGGGIKSQGSFVFVNDSQILSNRTDRDGGGVFAGDVTSLLLSNTLVEGNLAAPSGASQSEGHGGGIALRDGAALVAQGDSKFSKNQANFSGGAISVASGAAATLETGARVELNVARLGSGGGIAVGGSSDPVGDASLALKGAVTIAGNKAATDVAVPTRMDVDEGEVPDMSAIADLSLLGNGGGIYFAKGKQLLMEGPGIVIQDNKGGRQKMDIDGGLMISMGGGGVYADGGPQSEIRLEGVDLINNSTTGSGGGLFLRGVGSTSTSLTDVSVALNEAKAAGGGIYSHCNGSPTSITTTRLSIENNIAGHRGGGMAILNFFGDEQTTTINMNGGVIADNLVTGETIVLIGNRGSGGGIFAIGTVSLTMDGVTLEDNLAADGGGGGIEFLGGRQLTLNSCSILNNAATTTDRAGNGGGLKVTSGTCSLSGTTISGNETSKGSSGAGIFGTGAALVFGPGVSITGNRVLGLNKGQTDPLRPDTGGGIHGYRSITGSPQVSGNIPTDIFPVPRR